MSFYFVLIFLVGGAVIGSFLNVVAYRLQRTESVIKPRSYCPHCKNQIAYYHNIPILSYLLLKGRCAYCGASISARYIIVEIISSLMAVFIYWKFGFSPETIFYLYLTFFLIVISLIDLDTNLILNKVLLFLLAGGLILNGWLQIIPWISALIGMLAGGGLLLVFALLGQWYFKKESMGMGDVKFAAVLGFFLGWKLVLVSLYAGYLFAAFYFIYLRIFNKQPIREYVPMGPFFSFGSILFIGWWKEIFDYYLALIT